MFEPDTAGDRGPAQVRRGHDIAGIGLLGLGIAVGQRHVVGRIEPARCRQLGDKAINIAAHGAVVDVVQREAERELGIPWPIGDIAVHIEGLPDKASQCAQRRDVREREVVALDLAVSKQAAGRNGEVSPLLLGVQLHGVAVGHGMLLGGDHDRSGRRQAALVEAARRCAAGKGAGRGARHGVVKRDDGETRVAAVIGQRGRAEPRCRAGLDQRKVRLVVGPGIVELRRNL